VRAAGVCNVMVAMGGVPVTVGVIVPSGQLLSSTTNFRFREDARRQVKPAIAS